MLNQGLQGIEYANAPAFNSGATAKALDTYATGQAGNALSGYEGLLQGEQGLGVQAGSALAGVGTNISQQQSNSTNAAAAASGASSIYGANGFSVLAVKEVSSMSATVHGMLCAAIAAYRLEQQNFGGNVRSIVERDGICDAGEIVVVIKKSLVKTGKRYPASCYRDDDYEPGGLKNEQTHCVYTVQKNNFKFKILAAHCEFTS